MNHTSRSLESRHPRESGEGTRPLGSGHEVLIQTFNWQSAKSGQDSWYQELQMRTHELKDIGITAVWLPPPSDSVSAEGYMPRKLEKLDSKYGTAADLRNLIEAFHKQGISTLLDCVMNHRCADQQDDEGLWNVFTGGYSWDSSAICCDNPKFGGTGNHKEGEDFTAAPNVDHQCPKVKQDYKRWLRWLKTEVDADGWRFDFVKGYSGRHVKDYIRASEPSLAVGEFWDSCAYDDAGLLLPNQDAHRQRTIDWIDSTGGSAAAFDFTTKALLQEALAKNQFWRLKDSSGKPPGVIGWWPAHGVTFLDNHDTGSTQQHWPFPAEHLHEGYAYILTHPGMPSIFIDHVDEAPEGAEGPSLRATVCSLLALRRRLGIAATCRVDIVEASDERYAAFVDCKLAISIGGGGLWQPHNHSKDPGSTWTQEWQGPNSKIWSREPFH